MQNLKQTILDLLKSIAFKAISKKLFGFIVGGFKGFILNFLLDRVFSKALEPFLNLCIRKGYLLIDKTKGKILVKKFNRAKEENNEEDYNSTIDNL